MEYKQGKGNSLFTFVDSYVVVDIETTGLSPSDNEILEIGAMKIDEYGEIFTFTTLIKVDFPIPEFITQLTGIHDGMVMDEGIEIKEALLAFDEFVKDAILIGHNVNFDINFLNDKYHKQLDKSLSNDYIDTLRLSRRFLKGLPNHKLSTVVQALEIEYAGHHRALADVKMTMEVYECLKRRYSR